jgi:hypothetical protein
MRAAITLFSLCGLMLGCAPQAPRPVSEAPFAADSAQRAANLVQTYFALIEEGRHGDARRLWGDADISEAAFAAAFASYRDYHAEIGAPGQIEGAAGSLYVEVPVTVYGHYSGGGALRERGSITLRRVNNVPGATAAQLRWHIMRSTVPPEFH